MSLIFIHTLICKKISSIPTTCHSFVLVCISTGSASMDAWVFFIERIQFIIQGTDKFISMRNINFA